MQVDDHETQAAISEIEELGFLEGELDALQKEKTEIESQIWALQKAIQEVAEKIQIRENQPPQQ